MTDSEILSRLGKAAESGIKRDDLLREAVSLLKQARKYYNWIGIYLLDGDFLTLNNFVGRPTEHTRISIGSGVCGAAVADRENKVIQDVGLLDNYLACSLETESEIVVLIRRGEAIFGQIDIDSDVKNAFTPADEALLGHIAEILSTRF